MSLWPIIFALIIIVICRFKMNAARKLLSTEQKAKLIDISSRPWQFLVYVALVLGGLFFISYELKSSDNAVVALISWLVWSVLVILMGIWMRVSYIQRLKKANFPKAYLKALFFWSVISYIALIAFALFLILTRSAS